MDSPAGGPHHAPTLDTNRDGSVPSIMAHRGFSRDGAENTLRAFRAAWDLGCRWLELDVHTTRDGIVLVFHDGSLDRVTEGSGPVGEHTLAQIMELSIAGAELPLTFADLLEELPEARFNVDVKDAASVEPLAELLERSGAADRVRIASFSERRRRGTLRQLDARGLARPSSSAGTTGSALFIGCMLAAPRAWPLVRAATRRWVAPFDVVQLPLYVRWAVPGLRRLPWLGQRLREARLVTRRLIERAHAAGVQVHAWTVDEPSDMQDLIDDGVASIVTDRADLGLRAVRRRTAAA